MLKSIFIFLAVHPTFAAKLNGKSLNDKKYSAELELDNAKPIKGSVLFKKSLKAVFRAFDGTEVDIRIRNICAHGPDAEVKECWPNIPVELDDLSMRSGKLKISGKPKR